MVALLIVLVVAPASGVAAPRAVVFDEGCMANTLAANDDLSTGSVALPFAINFFGTSYTSVYVNNNGNLTFSAASETFTPFPLAGATAPIIAPFFADVDTRAVGSGLTHWGTTTFDGRTAFCATWADVALGVGYYPSQADKLNTFQVLLVDRSNVRPGDFDMVFNYNGIQWETGSASGGTGGLGGISARAGYSRGAGDASSSYEFPGSGVNGALLDTSPTTGLVNGSLGSDQLGRYVFAIRNGALERNDVWPRATQLNTSTGSASTTGLITARGQARWYQFDAPPASQFSVDVSNLPANYDLAVFKDIGAAYRALTSTDDLLRLTASSEAVAPSQFAPSQFAPSQFAPSQFAPSQFAPSQFAPSQFAPSQFAPSQFAPSQFAPSQFAPSQFAPGAPPPAAFSPAAFASAQVAAVIGLSAHDGTANESATQNTWDDTHFYVRVTGRNGEFDAGRAFKLDVTLAPSVCPGIAAIPSTATAPAGNAQTVILTDMSRMEGSAADKATLGAKLTSLAARPEVVGTVVDLGSDPRIQALNAQADGAPACPYAKNLVAGAIKDVVDAYRAANPVKYVVIVGNDRTIPFFRYPDQAGLGPESQYSPPVADPTASLAALRLDYVLSQDAYGAKQDLPLTSMKLPIPDLPVGRLIETPTEISGVIDAYLGTAGGVTATPRSSLVTGYDFLSDAGTAVQDELSRGLGTTGATKDTLITNQGVAPTDVGLPPLHSWTADQLRAKLLGARHDLIFLAGHFSANNALAGDFATTINSTELDTSTVDLANTIVFSAGCHAGYNIVNADAIPNVTVTEDWAQAFARKKATLIAGTGYQYGDSDFLEYSERLYTNFAHALRLGTGPVSVGAALVRAKQDYLKGTATMRGMHAKAFLEATLFGLPMLSVSMPAGRIAAPSDTSVIAATTPFATNPGSTLGLSSADLALTPALTEQSKTLTNVGGGTVTASWLSGPDGIVTNPGEPALPLTAPNVSVPAKVLRGVGFRGGTYSDQSGVTPLTGAPATESPGIHTTFLPQVFLPRKLWTVNYFGALAGGAATGTTRLMVTPVQYRGDAGAQTSTRRKFSTVALRLYYSGNFDTFGANTPAQAAAPTIARVSTTFDAATHVLTFTAQVVGDPSAGIQSVWVVYSGLNPGKWEPLDLQQSATDSSIWSAPLNLGTTAPSALRYVAQAVNGVGLVTLDDNVAAYYTPGSEPGTGTAGQQQQTALTLNAPSSGRYGDTVPLAATLTAGGAPVPNASVTFSIGGLTRSATTDATGTARTSMPLLLVPRTYGVGAGFEGDATHASSSASGAIAVGKALSTLTLTPAAVVLPTNSDAGNDVTAALKSGDAPLRDQTILFVVRAADGSVAATVARSTDFLGQAHLQPVNLPVGAGYVVTAYFGGTVVVGTVSVSLGNVFYEPASATGTTVQVVGFRYGGLLFPIVNPPQVNTWVRGVPVPVRFTLGTAAGLGIFAPGYPQSQPIDCSTLATTGAATATTTPLGIPLVYEKISGQYVYAWKTLTTYTGCRQLLLRFVDGTTFRAFFKFKSES